MKKINLCIIFLLFIANCGKPLTNKEIIKKTRECYEGYMLPEAYKFGWKDEIIIVRCITKAQAKTIWAEKTYTEALKELEEYHLRKKNLNTD